jgi:hypothetical protein
VRDVIFAGVGDDDLEGVVLEAPRFSANGWSGRVAVTRDAGSERDVGAQQGLRAGTLVAHHDQMMFDVKGGLRPTA